MFCFQCEETAGGKACKGNAGMCGKTAQTAGVQDRLTGALVGLARATYMGAADENTYRLLMEGLFATVTNVNFDSDSIVELTNEVLREKDKLIPGCRGCTSPCGKNQDYDMDQLWKEEEDTRSLKSLILFGIRGMAAYAFHALALGYEDQEINRFFCKGLFAVGEEWGMDLLLPVVMETGAINLKCMELLDRANTETYGEPRPAQVSMAVEKGPFIVVSGHDLHDLKLILEQTRGKGIHIYTHGEMLPAHGYPKLAAYSHLKGNIGTAWQNQQKEFDGLPAPVLFTTNCLMKPEESYKDRVFTTAAVRYPGMRHIGTDKDFTMVMNKALELGGYEKEIVFKGINGGSQLTTGYAHGAVLADSDKIVAAVKSGAVSRFFLVGGCDGAENGRSYYTDLVKSAPKDSLILTLGCGKYRFNDLDLGTIGSFPRILDMGQCNDAYGAVRVALALADAFQCGINDLPLSVVLSWYEQKAVSVLLSLLHLGFRNIYMGPKLPAFVSENVRNYLAEHFELKLTGDVTTDLAVMTAKR